MPYRPKLPSTTRPELLTSAKAAKYLGITQRSLLNYHKTGLLIPFKISNNGYRIYLKNQLDRFRDENADIIMAVDEYTIEEVAAITGIPSATLRLWDKNGSMPCLRRLRNKRRVYSRQQLSELCTDLGIPIPPKRGEDA